MLIKRKSGEATRTRLQAMNNGLSSGVLDRRSFLTQSGLALGGVAAIGSIQLGAVRKAEAGPVNRAARPRSRQYRFSPSASSPRKRASPLPGRDR